MFRKNVWRTALAALTMVASLSTQAHINYRHDIWRDPAAAGRISDLYFGIQGAYVQSNWDDVSDALEVAGIGTTGVRTDFDDAEFGGRLFVRWDFSPFFGVEGGVSYIDGSEFIFDNAGGSAFVEIIDPPNVNPQVLKDKSCTVMIDATWVTRVPLQNNFTFYTKFGANLMLVKSSFKFRLVDNGAGIKRFIFAGDDNSNLSITFGLGFNYKFSERWFGDLSFQHFRGNDTARDFIADVNMYMLGLSYRVPLNTCTRTCL